MVFSLIHLRKDVDNSDPYHTEKSENRGSISGQIEITEQGVEGNA